MGVRGIKAMKAKPSLALISSVLGVSTKDVRKQFAKNAIQLRSFAALAGAGKYRGKAGDQWLALAEYAEKQAKSL